MCKLILIIRAQPFSVKNLILRSNLSEYKKPVANYVRQPVFL